MSKTIDILEDLRDEAFNACRNRCHTIIWEKYVDDGPISFYDEGRRLVQEGVCSCCQKTVNLRTHPRPNEINIGGEAVALDCNIAWTPGPGQSLFRALNAYDYKKFLEDAAVSDPPNMEHWEIYHPVSRQGWEARGIHPDKKEG